MKEQIIKNFALIDKIKITFNPAIKIKMSPHTHPTFIDDMCKVNNTYMLTVSTMTDNCKKNIDSLTPEELQSLNIRLWSMANKPVNI